VGQGDCILIEFPKGKRALIDGGGFYDDRFDVGKNVIAPFLWKKKIRKIDFLVLTHPDPDHLNGLKFIARNFKVDELWDSGLNIDSPSFLELMETVQQKGIRRVSLFRGQSPRIVNGVTVRTLHPARSNPGMRGTGRGTNNFSLVLKLTFGRRTFLFTGDIEREAEAELVASHVDLRGQVIKVPHHGSNTSSTERFLDRVQPEIAIISARETAVFRLPNRKVLKRYTDLGCKILRTDHHGAVILQTDGSNLKIRTILDPVPGGRALRPGRSFRGRFSRS
jgi:competence protein ComEC